MYQNNNLSLYNNKLLSIYNLRKDWKDFLNNLRSMLLKCNICNKKVVISKKHASSAYNFLFILDILFLLFFIVPYEFISFLHCMPNSEDLYTSCLLKGCSLYLNKFLEGRLQLLPIYQYLYIGIL